MHILSCGADDRILFSVHRYARAVLISVYARFGVSWKVVTVFIADTYVTAIHLAPGRAVITSRDYLVIVNNYGAILPVKASGALGHDSCNIQVICIFVNPGLKITVRLNLTTVRKFAGRRFF